MSRRNLGGFIRPGYNPLRVPNAPTIGTASATSGTAASVPFTAPSCVGGSAITGYTAVSSPGCKVGTAASSPISVGCLTAGTAYTFRVYATNSYGPSAYSAASNSVTPPITGQQAYTSAGTYTWVAPTGVTSVSVVAVGAGGFANTYSKGGGGGGLAYKNNISVTPGNSYTVFVAAGNGTGANTTYFCGTGVVAAGRGTPCGPGGTKIAGDGGGTGGTGGNPGTGALYGLNGGGGGAAGYTGNGGNGGAWTSSTFSASPTAGTGGGGGGGGASSYYNCCTSQYYGGAGGGGVGILGSGSNGAAGTNVSSPSSNGGGGGSGGTKGSSSQASGSGAGGLYGGGSGGTGWYFCAGWQPAGTAAAGGGAVRIIWPGNTRQFPSTCTGDK